MIIITAVHMFVTYVSYSRYAALRSKYTVPIQESEMRLEDDMPIYNPYKQPFQENLAMLAVMLVVIVLVLTAINEFPDIRIRGFYPL